MPYVNTDSGLSATDVQDAIDEVEAEIAAISPGGTTDVPSQVPALFPTSTITATKDSGNPTFNFEALPENVVKVGSTSTAHTRRARRPTSTSLRPPTAMGHGPLERRLSSASGTCRGRAPRP